MTQLPLPTSPGPYLALILEIKRSTGGRKVVGGNWVFVQGGAGRDGHRGGGWAAARLGRLHAQGRGALGRRGDGEGGRQGCQGSQTSKVKFSSLILPKL